MNKYQSNEHDEYEFSRRPLNSRDVVDMGWVLVWLVGEWGWGVWTRRWVVCSEIWSKRRERGGAT